MYPERVSTMNAAIQFRSAVLYGLLVVLAIASKAEDSATGASLKLRVRSDGQHYTIEWDRSAPELARATSARLQVVEGTNPPSYLQLTREQLGAGILTYGSFPFTANARFRLELIGVAAEASGATPAPQAPFKAPPPRTFRPPSPPIAQSRIRPAVVMLDPPAASVASANPFEFLPDVAAPGPLYWTFASPHQHRRIEVRAEATLPDPPLLSYRIPTAPQTALALVMPPPVPAYADEVSAPVVAAVVVSGNRVGIPSGAGVLTITSEPAGAFVEINDQPAGSTPVAIQVSPLGIGFTVTLTKPGFRKWTIQSLATSEPASLHAMLREIRR